MTYGELLYLGLGELSNYVTQLGDTIDADPSSYEEVAKKKGKETMIKEYQLIKRNDV